MRKIDRIAFIKRELRKIDWADVFTGVLFYLYLFFLGFLLGAYSIVKELKDYLSACM